MTTSDDRAIALLQSLYRIYRDGAETYATADHDLPDPEVGRELEGYLEERTKLIAELEQRLRDLRAVPETSPTAGSMTFVQFRAENDANPVEALLSELERSEDGAVEALRGALQERDIDATTRKLLERHYERVQAAHDRIKQLRDRARLAQT